MMPIERLKRRPAIFQHLTGISIPQFDRLSGQFKPVWEAHERNRKNRHTRRRSIGGGRRYCLSMEGLLLMTLMYYRLYISQEFIGYLFDLDQSNVCRNITRVHPLLSRLFRIPEKRITRGEDEIRELIYDATEQEVERPCQHQREYYSGKKKRHTLKHQVVINKSGKIKAVSSTCKGKTRDKKIYEKSRIQINVPVTKKGDRGYLGRGIKVPVKKPKGGELSDQEKEANRLFSKERIIIEHVIGKLKIFKILSYRFRNRIQDHYIIFKNVAGLYNLRFA